MKLTRRHVLARFASGSMLSLHRALGISIAAISVRSPADAAERVYPARRARLLDSAMSASPIQGDAGPHGPVRRHEFNIVGQYGLDGLLEAPMQRLLDNLAASPSAFGTVRFFHALDSGTRASSIDHDPLDGGTTWPRADGPIDFSNTFKGLETLTSRGLKPFIVLNFFPKAVSGDAAKPPASFDSWKTLIGRFLDELAADPRFGTAAMRDWWFEVWNEPNGAPFWHGRYNPQYFDLYRATSEAVVASGHPIKLGGPAIIYNPDSPASRADMKSFLEFLSANPAVRCDFISLHAKGGWSSSEEAEFRRPILAATETAELALAIDRPRFFGLPIINDEADMRVGFEVPYAARMDERFAAWLCSLMIAYDAMSSHFSDVGFRFSAASDNANQQLVRNSFDGRRSLFTRTAVSAQDLLKLPVYNFYEVVRLLGDRHGTLSAGHNDLYPNSELFHLVTVADTHITSVFSVYPRDSKEAVHRWELDYSLDSIPWQRINIARFRIDSARSNSYGAIEHAAPFVDKADAAKARQAQELSVSAPIVTGVEQGGATFHESLTVDPYTVFAYWITPFIPDALADPIWIGAEVEDGNVVLRWRANSEPFFYSYEVYLLTEGEAPRLLSPVPLRAAIWVDTAPPSGRRSYAVRAVSASGVVSSLVKSAPVTV